MLDMAEVQYIKHLYEREGKSLREIAQQTKLNFRTVQKYVNQSDFNVKTQEEEEPAQKYPVLGAYIGRIDSWLTQDMREPRKQWHTAKRVYTRLKEEEGYKGCRSNVERYVAKRRKQLQKEQEGYLPIAAPQGHAQVDFGETKYYDGEGLGHKANYLIVSFPYSNAGWMQIYPGQNQECLLEGLKSVFKHVGGTPISLRCDNMSTAVAQVQQGTERVLTDGFLRFKLHYRFETEFCNAASGNEKGNVENKVGYDRRNMLVPVPTIEGFTAYNRELLKRCDEDHNREHYTRKLTIAELWEQEKTKLLTLPEYDYEVFRYESCKVNKTGFVVIDTNRYGLSPSLSHQVVQAKVYFERVELYYERRMLISYPRSYGRREEVSDWKQYLPTLISKPGAAEHTRFYDQLPKLWQEYIRTTKGVERKDALLLLTEMVKDGNEGLCDDALELAGEYGKADIDSIRQCYYLIAKPEHHPRPLQLTSNPPRLNYSPDLRVYDALTGRNAV